MISLTTSDNLYNHNQHDIGKRTFDGINAYLIAPDYSHDHH